jgi:hypothetical protein
MNAALQRTSLLLLLTIGLSLQGYSQTAKNKTFTEGTTNTTFDASLKNLPKTQKPLRFMYLKDGKGRLSGNRCALLFSEKMGIQYVMMPKSQAGSPGKLQQTLHNLGVRFLLTFRNGPFWHLRLNRKIKDCRQKTGDYAG